MISFGQSGGRRLPSRFVIATIIVPVGLIAVSLPINRVMGQYVAGRVVIDGSIEFSGTLFLMELVGWVLTGTAIFLAANHADPETRPFTSPLPMVAAAATLGSVFAGGGLAPDTPPSTTFGMGLGGMALGGLMGLLAARLILDPADLVVPVGSERSAVWSRVWRTMFSERPGVARLGVDATDVGEWEPPTWVDRTSQISLWHWVLPVVSVIPAVQMLGLRSPLSAGLVAVEVVAWSTAFWSRRLRVAIGSAGVLVSSAILATPMVGIELDRIESVEVIAQDRNRFSRWWRYDGHRLTISTGPGPALLLVLGDESEILLSIPHAADAAAEVTRHLR